MTTLLICPHLDDESLSCGGLILNRLQAEHTVHLCCIYGRVYDYGRETVHDSVDNERADFLKAVHILGLERSNIISHNVREGEPHRVGYYHVLQLVEQVLAKVCPSEVVIPSGYDMNQDHRFLYDVCKIALRPANLGSVQKIICFMGLDGVIRDANYLVPLSKETMEQKIQAVCCYQREMREGAHPRATTKIKALYETYGAKIGVQYAEPYQSYLIKEEY